MDGVLATEADVREGRATFFLGNLDEVPAVPWSKVLPACAIFRGDGDVAPAPVVVIQVEVGPRFTMVGYRPLSGGNGICMLDEVEFVVDDDPRWPSTGGTTSSWMFEDSPNLGVFTTRSILPGGAPILLVMHDAEGGDWQFQDGGDVRIEDAMLVALEEIVAHDPTIAELFDLPRGWVATRSSPNSPWQRSPRI
jgi:hypothetical protein